MDPSPYDAPLAALLVADQASDTGFLSEPREVGLGAGMDWLAQGWRYFQMAAGIWIAILVLWIVLFIVLQFVPFLGGIATNLLMPVVSAGVVLGCDALRRGDTLRIEHLFAGFSANVGQLVLIGVINLGITVVVVFGALMLMFGGLAISGQWLQAGNEGPGVGLIVGFVAFMLVVTVPLAMAMAFSPALVAVNGMGAVEAMLLSLKACMRNLLPLIILMLLVLVIALVATLPLFLGWLVAGPVLVAANFAAYREIFYAEP